MLKGDNPIKRIKSYIEDEENVEYELEEEYEQDEENDNYIDDELGENEVIASEATSMEPIEEEESEITEDLFNDGDEEVKAIAEEVEKEIPQENNEQMLHRYYNDESLSEYEKDELLNDLAAKNIKTVYYVVNKLRSFQGMVSLDEMASAGMLGYAKAIKSYDPTREVKFSTFAINCIKNEIKFCLRKERKHYDRNISMNYTKHQDKNGNDLTIEDTLPDNSRTPEEELAHKELRKTILKKLNMLMPMEKYVAIYRRGLDRGIKLTQKDIAQYVNMSQANISKIERNCTDKMHDLLRNEN